MDPSKFDFATGTKAQDSDLRDPAQLDPENPLHQALARLGKHLEGEKGAAPNGAAKGYSM
jgi:hypothetical protein